MGVQSIFFRGFNFFLEFYVVMLGNKGRSNAHCVGNQQNNWFEVTD
jgi:hypothetical protein